MPRLLLGCALVTSAALLAFAASRDSPTWDEVGHLPAGISTWHFGNFDLFRVNPPLVRMVAAAPGVATNAEADWTLFHVGKASRPEFLVGCSFVDLNRQSFQQLFFFARLACIVFAVIGAMVCVRWAHRLYGNASGLLAAALWAFCPSILAHGHLITPDVGAASLGALASYLFWRWLRESTWKRAAFLGVALGLAELTKMTWIVLFGLWPVLLLIFRWKLPPNERAPGPFRQLAFALLLAVYVLNLGYAFEGSFTRLGDFQFVSQALSGDPVEEDKPIATGNRFADSWLGYVPIPLPKNYLLGIDCQKLDFELKLWSYLGGEWKRGGWWYYYLYALAIKVPLGTWALIGLAAWCSLFRKGYSAGWRDELVLLAPLFTILIFVSSQTGFSHHMRYVLPIFPFAFIWASKVFRSYELKHYKTFAVACAALLWTVVSSLSVYPHSLSYFNELVGGPKGGHWHLGNSNIDWGQDLLYLKKWLDAHPEASHSAAGPIGVSYDNILDPSVVGIEYRKPPVGPTAIEQDLPPPEQQGPLPGWYAISVNHLHGRTKEYEYFLRFEPTAMAGYSMYIYHLTPDQVNPVRRELGLPELP